MVPADLWAARPGGVANSIAWLVWHVARCEDVAINTIVRDAPQVLTDEWSWRLRVDDARIGTGFTDAEVDAVGRSLDVDELDRYWTAVRGVTAAWLERAPRLDCTPDVGGRLRLVSGVVPPAGEWLLDQWTGKPAAWFVSDMVIAHGYLHLGEMLSVRGLLGIEGL